ncbi:hypothetical protein [Pantoea sp. KPR_PJ]|uniref:hypothetical protein n=1 Tax=Pantoea sp. KPR_PJ TaxID=2738375 RepID=UPI003526D1FD
MQNPANTLITERDQGLLIVDRAALIKSGDKVALFHDEMSVIARTDHRCVITDDGQKITGEELEGVVVLGKITYEIVSVWHDSQPI